MLIHGQESGNSYGCVNSIKTSELNLVVQLKWQNDFFNYNKDEIEEEINGGNISSEMKLALFQYIEKTNQLMFRLYREKTS